MKRVKMNYRQKSITALTESGMTTQEATSYYNRIYSQALRSASKSVRQNLNVARELYVNMFIAVLFIEEKHSVQSLSYVRLSATP